MEGAFYLREALDAAHTGVLAVSIPTRFTYYISDLPLDHEANLSGSMGIMEGLPPLYAITREVLREIFLDRRT